jgi:hypothetical protein
MKTLTSGNVWLPVLLLALSPPTPLTCPAATPLPQAKAEWTDVAKIVAIGDIHGAYEEFVALLQELGLIDQKLNWTGGQTHFVQTGDTIDRGPHDKKVLDLLMELEKQAEKAGGRVHCLLGNHEAMNIMGDLRYVAREAYAAFATEKSEELREKTYARYVKYRAARAARQIPPQSFKPDQKFKEEWMSKHPPGYVEHRKAFSESGLYGRWLSNHHAVLRINNTLFLHGGIAENLSQLSVREINDSVRRELKTFYDMRQTLVRSGVLEDYLDYAESSEQVALEVKYLQAKGGTEDTQLLKALQQFQTHGNWLILSSTGPLWYRGYEKEPEETFKPTMERIKANLKADHFVVGHTPVPSGITSRFSSAVFLIDTGMLRHYYKGRCGALVIENGQFTPVYPKSGPCA